jgi:hypothetical protein
MSEAEDILFGSINPEPIKQQTPAPKDYPSEEDVERAYHDYMVAKYHYITESTKLENAALTQEFVDQRRADLIYRIRQERAHADDKIISDYVQNAVFQAIKTQSPWCRPEVAQ